MKRNYGQMLRIFNKILKIMKKVLFITIVTITIMSCSTNNSTTVATVDPHVFGQNFDSTANMDAIKSTMKSMENFDSLNYVSKYADTAVFIDNGKKVSLAENVAMQQTWIKMGIKAKINQDYSMWSSHFDFKNNVKADYVYTYMTVNFTKGANKTEVVIFQADEFNKDGKIAKEYLVYDQSGMAALMK